MQRGKNSPRPKAKPSKEVLEMVREVKANRRQKTAIERKREDLSQAAARIVGDATENH
jgi:hypothetical protein